MQKTLAEIETISLNALLRGGLSPDLSQSAAVNCRFLEGVGYPGLKLLHEALGDDHKKLTLQRDALGLDLQNVSCVFLGAYIARDVASSGRVFLRNVRHGLYLLPISVDANIGIGCPVDPGFALGGERTQNPYVEKLASAAANGVTVDDALWRNLEAM